MIYTEINWLMLFKEIIAVYCENHMKHTNAIYGKNAEFYDVKAGGACSHILALTD
jgi:hypothetical protein